MKFLYEGGVIHAKWWNGQAAYGCWVVDGSAGPFEHPSIATTLLDWQSREPWTFATTEEVVVPIESPASLARQAIHHRLVWK